MQTEGSCELKNLRMMLSEGYAPEQFVNMKGPRPAYTRRALHGPHLSQDGGPDFVRSPSQEKGFDTFFPKPGTSNQDTFVVLESTKEKGSSDQDNNNYCSLTDTVTGSICGGASNFWKNTINEDWVMYSIWSEEGDCLVEGLEGRRMPLEQDTFVDGVRTHVKKMFSKFPMNYFCDVMVIIIGHVYPYIDEQNKFQAEASQLSFHMAEKKCEGKTRSRATLRCYGQLSAILGQTVSKSDVLVIKGAVFQEVEGKAFIELNNDALWKQNTVIVRLVKRDPTTCQNVSLGELIKPVGKIVEGSLKDPRFCFEYRLNIPRGTVEVTRHRQCRPDSYKEGTETSVLDKYFFPITTASLQDCVDTLSYYDMDRDASWPQKYGAGRVMKKLPRYLHKFGTPAKKQMSCTVHHKGKTTSTWNYRRWLIALVLIIVSVLLSFAVLVHSN